MSSTREKAEAILQDVLARVEELKAEALSSIEAIRQDAEEKVGLYEDAREELEGVEARLVMLEAEREGLPIEHSRAVLADDVDEELRVKERYSTISEEIEDLEVRKASVEEEMAKLAPRAAGAPPHRHDASRRQYGRVAKVAAEERRALEYLRKQAVKALDDAVAPVAEQHDQFRGLVSAWGEERKLDPEQREWLDKVKAREAATYREQEAARERSVQAKRQSENAARVLASRGPRDEEE
jgi:hypothetical protein